MTKQTHLMRADVRASWDRAQRRGLHPDRHLPDVGLNGDEVRTWRRDHRMASVWPVLFASLESAAFEPGHVLFGGDADGHLLWVQGDAAARRGAERANLVPGARWHEAEAGTNGVGTALTLGRAFQVRGTEHYLSVAADFTCSAAPIRDPVSGAVIGVVDVTCKLRNTSPLALPLVATAARLAEAHLRELTRQRDAEIRTRYLDRILSRVGDHCALLSHEGRLLHASPPGWLPAIWPAPLSEGETELPDGRRVVLERLAPGGPFSVYALPKRYSGEQAPRVSALGRHRAVLWMDGVVHDLSLRHSELVVLLLANPDGLTAAVLAEELYGNNGKTVTVRAELTRLRRIFGYRLSSDPYRLDSRIRADFRQLEADVAQGVVGDLHGRYPGPLLPGSKAPGVRRIRERLHHLLASVHPSMT
ncbi:GAF domain-containing protein [Nocardia sp. NBC_00508]|uniref:GAF domain-containing protein n=1 Tax=Nocardia sp. NBC_00508 TaxID=2975992 RepID=UPI002E80C374|nr:GAF domain-containing protein [Nocardia sp. NBC_00508]WUD69121.1 GAF domain-containing protein [Nocardia sp. NBC_00508]